MIIFALLGTLVVQQASAAQSSNALEKIRQDASVQSALQGATGDNVLVPIQTVESAGVRTEKFQHYYRGLEVVGAWTFEHHGPFTEDKVSHSLTPVRISTVPTLTSDDASRIALSLGKERRLRLAPVLKILPNRTTGEARLTYYVELEGDRMSDMRTVILDAHSGDVIADLDLLEDVIQPTHHRQRPTPATSPRPSVPAPVVSPQIPSAKGQIAPIEVRSAQGLGVFTQNGALPAGSKNACEILDDGADAPRGYPVAINPTACKLEYSSITGGSPADNDASASNAAKNSKAVLDYYLSHHGRNSFDDHGSKVVSIIHVGDKFNNAFWNPLQSIMAYGDGNPADGFGDFSLALDVAGHEMTHGVTAFTAKLTMMDEAGALNEANSDFFGKMIANDGDWIVGKAIFLDVTVSKGIRDLARPENLTFKVKDRQGNTLNTRTYPSSLANKQTSTGACDSTNDRCYVHGNSTIPSHAAYLVSTAIGREKAEKLYYFVLTHLMHPDETFRNMAQDVMEGCSQLGFDAATTAAVKTAYTTVGLL